MIDWCNNNQGFLMVILTAIYVFATILIFKSNNKSTKLLTQQIELQKKQWLSDIYMKREAEILLEFRDAFYLAQQSIWWFLRVMLSPLRMQKMFPEQDVTPKPERLIVTHQECLAHFKSLNNLNNLYNKNQIIFRKYHLEDAMQLIQCMLDVSVFCPEKDLKYVLVKKEDMCEEYRLEEFGKIAGSFITAMAFNVDIKPDLSKKEDKEKMEYISQHQEEKLNEYRALISNKLNSLMTELDELTIYYEGKIPDNMKMRYSRFYPNIDREI